MELSGKISLIMSEIVLSVSTGTPDRGGRGSRRPILPFSWFLSKLKGKPLIGLASVYKLKLMDRSLKLLAKVST